MGKKITFFDSKYKWYFPLLIIIIISIGSFGSVLVYNKTLEKNKTTLLERTKTLSSFLEGKDFSTLSIAPSDETNPQYIEIKSHLQKAVGESRDARFMYVMVKKSGAIYFLADSERVDSPDYSAPGDEYTDESYAITKAFEGEAGIEGPIKDSWGTWFSGIAPIYSEEGDVIAIFGIDVSSDQYIVDALLIATIPVLITLFIVLVLMIAAHLQKKEEAALELRSRFVAIASHEIRSPLTGLSWALQSLEQEKLTDDGKQLLQKAHLNTENLIETINDILGITELHGEQKTNMFSFSLKAIVEQVVKDLELIAMKRSIKLEFQNQIPDDRLVHANGEKIKRVFANILSNAIKYSKDNSTVSINFIDSHTSYVVTIKDTGVGIPKEEVPKVLSGFYRASNVKKDYNGSGLGLYYAKQIIESYGGTITLESEEGKGTTISVSIRK